MVSKSQWYAGMVSKSHAMASRGQLQHTKDHGQAGDKLEDEHFFYLFSKSQWMADPRVKIPRIRGVASELAGEQVHQFGNCRQYAVRGDVDDIKQVSGFQVENVDIFFARADAEILTLKV